MDYELKNSRSLAKFREENISLSLQKILPALASMNCRFLNLTALTIRSNVKLYH